VVSHTHLCNQSVCLAGTLSLVSLIFSFMLVWDMPAIRRGVQSLKQSRLSIVYEEIAPVIGTFGAIFGKAMQAQSAIAVVNTALTALGLLVLQVSGVGFLSVLVFLCSFVPVAGVIISTVPIGLVAFTESGLLQLGLVVLMVILIHAVEAYILNPVIYSAHLKLHPLLALGVLVFAEHTLGVWGLLVAVPMAVFFSEYIIKRNSMTMGEDNKYRALPSVPS
jgi:predicted PurR-regulated permease PerM